MKISLKEIAQNIDGWEFKNLSSKDLESLYFEAINHDSRTINAEKKELFILAPGPTFDPHDFIEDALKKGAVAAFCKKSKAEEIKTDKPLILIEDELAAIKKLAQLIRSKISAPLLAITGSTGKTTTRELLISILKQKGQVLSAPWGENINTLWGNIEWLINYEQENYVVTEVSMDRLGEIKWQCEALQPDIGCIINIGEVHAGVVGGLRNVFKAKKEMADYLEKVQKPVVLNTDDPKIAKIASKLSTEVVEIGTEEIFDFWTQDCKLNKHGTRFTINTPNESQDIQLKIFGKDYKYNALIAAAFATQLSFDTKDIKAGLEQFEGFPYRFQTVKLNNYVTLINDAYNANPQSMTMSIKTYNQIWHKKDTIRIAILGDMRELGEVAAEAHKELGALVTESGFDKVYYIGDFYKEFAHGNLLKSREEVYEKISAICNEAAEKEQKYSILMKASNGFHLYTIPEEYF